MGESKLFVIVLLFVGLSVISGETPTNHVGSHGEIRKQQVNKLNPPGQYKSETQQTETLDRKQTYIQPSVRDGIRVTVSEPSSRRLKIDRMLNALDRVAYVMSKPAAVLSALKLVGIAVTSLVMSIFMLPGLGQDHSRRRYRARQTLRFGPFGSMSRLDLEAMIDSMAKNYDDTLNQAGFNDRSPCRERSLCIFGDMMACDFPNIIISIGKFAQNHLPPIDMNKNKYTRAIMLGMNQTDCDKVYQTNFYECPSFRDYVRSYLHGGFKKRRDQHLWWRN